MDETPLEPEAELASRPYQAQLEEIAAKKNTIIHLPTGSGKTFIAICVIKRFREALQKPWGQGGKRTFFLVNTVPLVIQQKKVIETLCPVKGVGAYSSEDGVDYWDLAKWEYELKNNQVFVMTCQILLDMLAHSYINLRDINLIIFDECHHAVDDHPMRSVMKYFESCPVQDQPRVLGLTATLLNANVSIGQVQYTLKDLETTFHATIATVNELGEVLSYSTNPDESVLFYDLPRPTDAVRESIRLLQELQDIVISVKLPNTKIDHELKLTKYQRDISTDPKKIVKAVKNMLVAMVMFTEELGAYGGAMGMVAYIILLERLKRKAITKEEELLYKVTITHSTEARLILLKSMERDSGYDKIIKHSSPRFVALLNILKEHNPNRIKNSDENKGDEKNELSCIIFTQQRFTAKVLYNLLKDVKDVNPDDFGFLKHDFLVGFNINPMKNTREQHYLKKASEKALLMFGRNELNCLISTSVIEEGVDIPQCHLVLRFDPPLEYRSYIQSKGRARSKTSKFIIMVNRMNQKKFLKNYEDFQRVEKYIHRLLVGSTDDRSAPTKDIIREQLYGEDAIPPYITPQGGRIPAVLAISLLNRYFSMLPHDKFTVLTPAWIQENVQDINGLIKRQVTIVMPLTCPIKDLIKGDSYCNIKSAKRSAALKACIKLHQSGELDAVTVLPKKYENVNYNDKDIRGCLPNWPWNSRPDEEIEEAPKPGTKYNVRAHRIAFPQCLRSVPDSNRYYLHIIKLTACFPEPKETRDRALYDFIKSHEGFGVLTQQSLPKICKFPTFLTVGEVETEIKMNYAVTELNQTLFELVKSFHLFLFEEVLAIAKKFLVFEGIENCMYCVPVCGADGYDIDWRTMQTYQSLPAFGVPSCAERRSLRVTDESYRNCVVTPWYRGGIQPDRYIVSNVMEHKTPQSHFDSESYHTYADYYASKYNLEIMGPKDQPLLEVRNISSRMNCLLPRAASINAFSDKQKKLISASQGDDKLTLFVEVFIPEFCIKYDFPGVLWYKAMMLPSILHRIQMLLTAQELIIEIGSAINYGNGVLPKNEIPLSFETQAGPDVSNKRKLASSSSSLSPRSSSYEKPKLKKKKRIERTLSCDAKIENLYTEEEVNENPATFKRLTSPDSDGNTSKWNRSSSSSSSGLCLSTKGKPKSRQRKLRKKIDCVGVREKKERTPSPPYQVNTEKLIAEQAQEWLPIVGDAIITKNSLLSNIEHPISQSQPVDRINQPAAGEPTTLPAMSLMKDSLYQLQKKKIDDEYPWDERQEPMDIERNVVLATVLDIEVYDEFVSTEMALKAESSRSPKQLSTPGNTAAIQAAPPKYIATINILSKKPVGRGPELCDVLYALTTINSHDVFNLERAETLGDSFLKFAASLYLFHKFPGRNEGQLTNIKCKLISNRNLYYAGERVNLGGRMKVEQFSPRKDFLLPAFFAPKAVADFIRSKQIRPTFMIGTQFSHEEVLTGKLNPESLKAMHSRFVEVDGTAEVEPPGQAQNAMQGYLHSQAVSDKSVADCVEAIIGTYLLSGGILAAVKILEWFRIIPPEDKLAKLLHKSVPTVISEGKATKKDINYLLDGFQPSIEEIINYKFKDSSLLLEAMSHASYIRNRLTHSYERFEFLGDAILDFLITAHIFENNPGLSPGDLTDLRSALVNNVTFASYVVKLELHKYICKELNPSLDKAIMAFVEHQNQRNHEIVEDVLYLIDEEDCQLAEYVEVPKALSDIFESLVGAIYVDCGGNLQTVWSVVYRIMHKEIHMFSSRIPRQPVKVLYEMIHACPVFGTLRILDQDVARVVIPVTFTLGNGGQTTVYGVGRNKSQAKRAAAKMALKVLSLNLN